MVVSDDCQELLREIRDGATAVTITMKVRIATANRNERRSRLTRKKVKTLAVLVIGDRRIVAENHLQEFPSVVERKATHSSPR